MGALLLLAPICTPGSDPNRGRAPAQSEAGCTPDLAQTPAGPPSHAGSPAQTPAGFFPPDPRERALGGWEDHGGAESGTGAMAQWLTLSRLWSDMPDCTRGV